MIDVTTTIAKSPEMQALEDRIKVLTDLNTSVDKLRHAPSVLRLPSGSSLATNVLTSAIPPATQLREAFVQLKELSDRLRTDSTQSALKAAKESEAKDNSELSLHNGRRNMKRTRPPSPEPPQPSRAFQQKSISLSLSPQTEPALQQNNLVAYLREYNGKRADTDLHVWAPSARAHDYELPSPTIIRFTIRDVLVVYLTLGYTGHDSAIIVEGSTAFGPREKKPPHSQSDYSVYQKLSQQLTKTLQAHPKISFQSMVVLLALYEDLFVRRCTACQRVLSAEGHVPPVVRVWRSPSQESEEGSWDARHADCLRS